MGLLRTTTITPEQMQAFQAAGVQQLSPQDAIKATGGFGTLAKGIMGNPALAAAPAAAIPAPTVPGSPAQAAPPTPSQPGLTPDQIQHLQGLNAQQQAAIMGYNPQQHGGWLGGLFGPLMHGPISQAQAYLTSQQQQQPQAPVMPPPAGAVPPASPAPTAGGDPSQSTTLADYGTGSAYGGR